jgi:energy-converting hydrogenase Eha subunit F
VYKCCLLSAKICLQKVTKISQPRMIFVYTFCMSKTILILMCTLPKYFVKTNLFAQLTPKTKIKKKKP